MTMPNPRVWVKRHVKYAGDDCLIWPFAKRREGRGVIWAGKQKHIPTHRLMCTLAHGNPPKEKTIVLHSCGNGHLACVNPKHLRWGDTMENVHDRASHGRNHRNGAPGKTKNCRSCGQPFSTRRNYCCACWSELIGTATYSRIASEAFEQLQPS